MATTIPKVQAATSNAQANACTKSCNMCEKDGLLILPVRYAAAAATNVHDLGPIASLALPKGHFGAGVTTVASRKASYFLRSVRKGFIHVYYQSQNKWQIYGVTTEGYVFNYPLDADLPETQEKAFNCQQTGHKELARCISIDHPKKAGKVYLAFSDVRWTDVVRKRFEANEQGCRDKRMQVFDALAWSSGNYAQAHAETIGHVGDYVLEYKPGMTDAQRPISPFRFKSLTGETDGLKQVMDAHEKGNGLFFALWDAAGVTQELNAEHVAGMGKAMQPYERGMWTTSAIEGLKTVFEDEATEKEESAATQMEGQAYENYAIYSLFDGGKRAQAEVEAIEKQKKAELPKVKEDAWKEFKNYYSPGALADFRKKMADAIQAVEKSTLTPLSLDHSAWLTGPQLGVVFAWDYHEDDQVTGIKYTELFQACIENSSGREAVLNAVAAWANGKVTDRDNLLLRSLIINHKPSAEKAAEAAHFPLIELRETLAKLIELNHNADEVLEKHGSGLVARAAKAVASVVHELTGPIASYIANKGDAAGVRVLVAALSSRPQLQVIVKPVTGTANQWVTYMARQIYDSMPEKNRPSMRDLKSNLRKVFIEDKGSPLQVQQFIVLDKNEMAKVIAAGKGKSAEAIFAPGAKAILTEENVTEAFLPKFNRFSQGDVAYGVVGMLFNTANWMIASKELKKASAQNETELWWKWLASVVAFTSGTVQTAGNTLKSVSKIVERSKELEKACERFGDIFEVAGRWAGAAAGLVGAWFDFKQSGEMHEAHHGILAALYTTSALANVAMCIAAVLEATFVGIILLIVVLAIGLIIQWQKTRELQEWLSKSYFGTEPREKQYSQKDERKQYELLTS
ncbi:T6SS effector BTH_I2691 family protein [Paraburkholderia bannensis]|uniref:T6SS effector BTH_I2691 family protein n=1 Tax=Paraburkholderia bannensis TaxID=765414 RepID=UPI002ABD992E|nr:T6SS effector BTH_I2691 family protein [Paraburkholderia bannensis]